MLVPFNVTFPFVIVQPDVSPDSKSLLANCAVDKVESIVILTVSINHSAALIVAPSNIVNSLPEVSINPSMAQIVPPTSALPPLANNSILPVTLSKQFASNTPMLFTTPFNNSSTALVVKYLSPPFDITVPLCIENISNYGYVLKV